MKKVLKVVLATAVTAIGLVACGEKAGKIVDYPYNHGINVTPMPVSLEQTREGSFELTKNVSFVADGEELSKIASFFASKIKGATGFEIQTIDASKNCKQEIAFKLVGSDIVPNEEGYKLDVSAEGGIVIQAQSARGIFWGMQTLLQLLPAEIESSNVIRNVEWQIPYVSITDEPKFGYRGMHLDPCRHFLSVEETKKFIDVLSMLKINKLHWHLTEDQGWRIESKVYPKLTELGSKRTEGDGTTYGPFYYTQDEIKDVVAYAKERYVEIIPEIEFPGHNVAALTAYPELGCAGADFPYEVRNIWGVSEEVLCAGNDQVFVFAKNILDEILPLFDSEYVHIGGDEAPKNIWAKCPKCQARKKAEGLKDELELQSYFIHRIEEIVLSHGKKMIGWEEILEGGLAPSAIVMSWTGEKGGITSANMGHDVIMCPASAGLYIDHYQGDPAIEPQAIGGFSTLERVYSYNPIPEDIEMEKRHHVLGVQADLWSEYFYESWQYEYHAFPREVAIAEIGWTPIEKKDFADFERRLQNIQKRLDYHDMLYYIPQPEQQGIGGSINTVAFTDSAVLDFKTNSKVHKIIYTLDGSEPTAENSLEYTAPLTFTEDATVNIRSLVLGGKMSPVREIKVVKQGYAPAVAQVTDLGYSKGIDFGIKHGRFASVDEVLETPSDSLQWSRGTAFSKTGQPIYIKDRLEHLMDNVNHYAAVYEGYINIPEDGIYRFSTLHNMLWINDQIFIDNTNEIKKVARHDSSIALAKGLHKIKVVTIGEIEGGWPTFWSDVRLKWSRMDKGEELDFIPDDAFYHSVK